MADQVDRDIVSYLYRGLGLSDANYDSNVRDNDNVGYQIFLRALHRYAKTEFRFGR